MKLSDLIGWLQDLESRVGDVTITHLLMRPWSENAVKREFFYDAADDCIAVYEGSLIIDVK